MKAMESMVFTALEAMKSVSYGKKVCESNRYGTCSVSFSRNPGKWRPTLDFVRLNAAAGIRRLAIPNIQQTLSQLGAMKPTVFGLPPDTT